MRLIMIPAFACDGDLYDAAAELLRADFDCEVIVPEEPTVQASAARILERAGDGPFMIWGTSLGGHVAREVAVAAPDRVAGLVVSGAGVGPVDGRVFDARRAAILADGGAAVLEDMARRIVFEPEGRGQGAADSFRTMSARAPREILLAQTDALATRPDRTAALPDLSVRTLLLWGEADVFTPPGAAREIAAAMPAADLVLLEECGHLPSLEAPMRAVAAIRRVFAADRGDA